MLWGIVIEWDWRLVELCRLDATVSVSFKVREVAEFVSKTAIEDIFITYSSTEFWGNGTRSSCLEEPENGLIIHNKRAMARMTVNAVRLGAATDLLLLRMGETFMAEACRGV